MANALEEEWNNYFVQLNKLERKSVLLMLKTFLQRHNEDTDRISMEPKQY